MLRPTPVLFCMCWGSVPTRALPPPIRLEHHAQTQDGMKGKLTIDVYGPLAVEAINLGAELLSSHTDMDMPQDAVIVGGPYSASHARVDG